MRINSEEVERRLGSCGQRGKRTAHNDRFGREIKKLIKDRALLSCFPSHLNEACRAGARSNLLESDHRLSHRKRFTFSFYSRLSSLFRRLLIARREKQHDV